MDPTDEKIKQLEQGIHRLRLAYEQYFRGVAKENPEVLAADVARRVRDITSGLSQVTNTGQRFKIQQMVARYNSFNTIWQKTLRGIDEGKLRRGRAGAVTTAEEAVLETNTFVFSTPGKEQNEMDRLIKRLRLEYVRVNAGTTPQATRIRKMVEDQTGAVKAKYGCEEVAYEVVSEGEKVKIRVKPVRKKG